MQKSRHSSTSGEKGLKEARPPTSKKRYGIHVTAWAMILAVMIVISYFDTAQFTGWAMIGVFVVGFLIGAFLF